LSAVLPDMARQQVADAVEEECLQPREPSFQPRRARAGPGNEAAAANVAAQPVAGEVESQLPDADAYRN